MKNKNNWIFTVFAYIKTKKQNNGLIFIIIKIYNIINEVLINFVKLMVMMKIF